MEAESRMPVTGLLSPDPPESSWARLRRNLLQLILILFLALLSYLFISHFLLQTVRVVGSSMAPTLSDSDRYLLNRWVFLVRDPRVGEIVVIRDPADGGFSVKRVIAGTGDKVEIRKDGRVLVNGEVKREPYLARGTPTYPLGRVDHQSFELGTDQFFLLGDNRMNSADSRIYGPVNRRDVLGLLVF